MLKRSVWIVEDAQEWENCLGVADVLSAHFRPHYLYSTYIRGIWGEGGALYAILARFLSA